ncbi:uncharacterized protein Z520_11515 [Fonsecaea multimorphosa CBS 102226]|uniref:HPP transmembrane region domain-containing protein n=1 Tax=Fonsecaea multimorphosa CBS 102226 TaxID=1442371 RepID=A0A0D2I6L1_9EURO|nr:uncharacterized protein Z520_11515 [Fonsecaea multimorphosa CBS 102226]KIX92851.1 hypothetical protein Z520_11515 [Fonsecaea multimorphosa CBS 102226]OAL18099.1 hypothetical protein AYO22_11022 [Fonsecaea multimorphosa]
MPQQQPANSLVKAQPPKPTPKVAPKHTPFDIDNYLNPFIPRNPLRFLPSWVSYWFGYRSPSSADAHHPCLCILPHQYLEFFFHPPEWFYIYHVHTFLLYLSILIGAFCGVAIIENVFLALPQLSGHTVPIVIASFGAAAILEYNTIESPLAQPRNLVFGHFLSALVGVGITKLFLLLPPDQFEDLRWLAGALAVGCASIVMSFTKTIHPPAGATALLAATNVEIQDLGWWLLPLVLLAAMLMLASALVVNNLSGRRYPVYWWTPVDLKHLKEERRKARLARKLEQGKIEGDVEKGAELEPSTAKEDVEDLSDTTTEAGGLDNDGLAHHTSLPERMTMISRAVTFSSIDRVPRPIAAAEKQRSKSSSKKSKQSQEQDLGEEVVEGESILISRNRMIVPEWLDLSDWEDEVLRILMVRMQEHSPSSDQN